MTQSMINMLWNLLLVTMYSSIASCIVAGPIPMPLEAQLDLASDVVVGRIVKITPVKENLGEGSYCGRITVEVEETLKGRPAKTVQFLGVTGLDPGWGGAAGFHLCQVGDEGIWLIENGWLSGNWPLPKNKRAEVDQDLKDLKDRKWSQPVNGLRAWAAVTESVIIFAVRNDSNADVFLPYETEKDFVAATVTDDIDTPTRLVLRPNGSRSEVVSCQKLTPGQIVYLHPGYSSIDLARRQHLAPGSYPVIVSCTNDRTKGEAAGDRPGTAISVTPWQGELCAPAVKLTILAEKRKAED